MADQIISQIAKRAKCCIDSKKQKLQKQLDKLECEEEEWEKVRRDPLGHSPTKVKKNDWLFECHKDVERVRSHQHLYLPPRSVPLSFFEENVGNPVRLKLYGVSHWNDHIHISKLEDVYTVREVTQRCVYLRLVQSGEEVIEKERVEECVYLFKHRHIPDLSLHFLNAELLSVYTVTFDREGKQNSAGEVASSCSERSTLSVWCDLVQ